MRWVLLLAIAVGVCWWIGAAGFAGGLTFVGAVLAATATFFVVGGLPFWGVLALAVGIAWFLEESKEDGALAVIPFVAFCLFVQFISRFDLLGWGRENLHYIFTRGWQYVALGVAYALARWVIHVQKKANEIDGLEKKFREGSPFVGPMQTASVDIRVKFTEFLRYKYNPNLPKVSAAGGYNPAEDGVVPELLSGNAFVFFRWLWWWPFSLLGYVLNDLIRKAYTRFKRLMRKVADGLSGLIFGHRANYVLTATQAEEARRAQLELPQRVVGGEHFDHGEPGDLAAVAGTPRT